MKHACMESLPVSGYVNVLNNQNPKSSCSRDNFDFEGVGGKMMAVLARSPFC